MADDWDVVETKPISDWDVVSHEAEDDTNIPYANAKNKKEGGIGRNIRAGVTEAFTGIPAGAGWLAEAVLPAPGVAKAGQEITHALNEGLGYVGLNPEDVGANTPAERLTRFTSGAVAGAFTPGGPEATMIQKARSGLAFGLGGGFAEEAVPDWAKPYAAMVGGLFSSAGVEGLAAGGRKLANSPFAAALSDKKAEQIGGNVIAKRASDINQTRTDLENNGEIVPGSEPTTFQQTGDLGLGELERQVSSKSPALFTQRAEEQNKARRDAMSGIQAPGQGNQNDLAQFFRDKLDDFDRQTADHTEQLLKEAQEKTAKTGGVRTPEAMGEDLRKVTVEASEAAKEREKDLWKLVPKDETGNTTATIDAAKGIRDEADQYKAVLDGDENALLNRAEKLKPVEKLGTLLQLRSDVSDAMRTELAKGASQKYRRLVQLRGAIQDNIATSLGDVYSGSLKNPANSEEAELMRGIDKNTLANATSDVIETSKAPESPESLFDVARSLGGIKPSIVGGKETAESAAVRARLPLNAKNGKSQSTWETFMETLNQRGWLRHQANGGEHPDDLIEALDQEASGKKYYHPEDDSAERLQRRDQIEQEMNEAGIQAGDSHIKKVAKLANYRSKQNAAEDEIPGFERANTPTQTPPKPTTVIKPTFSASSKKKIEEATAETKENKRTYGRGPVGAVLARAGMQDLFKLPESRVPEKFFHPGPSGFQDTQALYKAVGQQNAEGLLSDYAASTLRKAAMKEDGTLDPKKFARWKKNYSESLRGLPADVRAQFEDAGTASQALLDAQKAREAGLKEMDSGAIGRVMKANNPEDVTRTIGGIFGSKTAVGDMRQLATEARSDPHAWQGLRQAVADHMSKMLVGNIESGTSGLDAIKSNAFQEFFKKNRAVLGQVLSPEEITNLGKIAADLKRANRTIAGVKLPGGSNTAQDTYELGKGFQPSRLMLVYDFLAERIGRRIAGPIAGIATLGTTHLSQMLYNAGVKNIDQVITKAMLDPQFAKEILKPVPKTVGQQESFKRAMVRAFTTGSKGTLTSSQSRP